MLTWWVRLCEEKKGIQRRVFPAQESGPVGTSTVNKTTKLAGNQLLCIFPASSLFVCLFRDYPPANGGQAPTPTSASPPRAISKTDSPCSGCNAQTFHRDNFIPMSVSRSDISILSFMTCWTLLGKVKTNINWVWSQLVDNLFGQPEKYINSCGMSLCSPWLLWCSCA